MSPSAVNPTSVVHRIAILAFVGGLGGGMAFPILPALGLELGIPAFMVGLILSMNRIARLAFNMPAGQVIGRLGARLTLSGALFAESLGVLGYSAALHFGNPTWWFLAGRSLFGIGTAFLWVGGQATVLSLSNKADRGRKVSSVRVAMSAAMPSGLIFGGVLADVFSDDIAFLAGAAVTFAGAVLAAAFLPTAAGRTGGAEAGAGRRHDFAALLASPRLPVLAAAWGFNLLVFLTMQGVVLTTMVLLVQERGIRIFGMEAQGASGLIMAVLIGCSALVTFGIGRAIDALPLRSTLLFPSLAGLAAGFAVLAVAHSLGLILLGAVLVGVSYNGITVPMLALLGDSVSERQYGPAVGVYQIFGDIGGAVGPIVGMEAATNIGLTPLYLAIAVLPALAIVAAFRVRALERRG